MSVITSHYISIKEGTNETLKNLLVNDGIFKKRTIYRYSKEDIVAKELESIDIRLCDEKSAKECLSYEFCEMSDISENDERHIANGWEVVSSKNGWTYFKKPWDKKVYDSLPLYPVSFNNDNVLCWIKNYGCDDTPAYAISKKYPNITFEYEEYIADYIVHVLVKDGKVVEDLRKKGE